MKIVHKKAKPARIGQVQQVILFNTAIEGKSRPAGYSNRVAYASLVSKGLMQDQGDGQFILTDAGRALEAEKRAEAARARGLRADKDLASIRHSGAGQR